MAEAKEAQSKPATGHMYQAKAEKNSRRSRKKLEHTMVKKADNGGHVITHHFVREGKEPYMTHHEDEENVFTDGKEAVHHLMKHMGVKDAEMAAHLGKKGKKKVVAKVEEKETEDGPDEEDGDTEEA